MWKVDNGTPFTIDRTWLCDRNGGVAWVVADESTPVTKLSVRTGVWGVDKKSFETEGDSWWRGLTWRMSNAFLG